MCVLGDYFESLLHTNNQASSIYIIRPISYYANRDWKPFHNPSFFLLIASKRRFSAVLGAQAHLSV